jgi:transcriptional regulator with XRE-family HTH domain
VKPNRIRELREAKGLTQWQLAQATGLWPARISEYETGNREPPLVAAQAIAAALEVGLDELFPREEVSA